MIQFKKLGMINYINDQGVLIQLKDLSDIDIKAINEFLENGEIKTILNFKGVIKK